MVILKRTVSLLLLCVLVVAALSACAPVQAPDEPAATAPPAEVSVKKLLRVAVLDTGKSDCIIVTAPDGKTMMIDAADKGDYDKIEAYLDDTRTEKMDVLVATHPHADHIGGMREVIQNYDIGEIIMTRTTHTTKTYENLLETIKDKGLTITTAKAGADFMLGRHVHCAIVAPVTLDYDELNNKSVVIRMVYGKNAFLFTGDMEEDSERDVLDAGYDVSADVLKVAHHGSSSSSTEAFIAAVSPDYAIICCKQKDDDDPPDQETLDTLTAYGVDIYRTGLNGDVMFYSDGTGIRVTSED